jgi:ring-1,2-phenylacetyl-CoA epoxidase subunit PaaC
VRLVELPNGDFAFSVARMLVFASWRLAHFEHLAASAVDPVLAAVAAKGVKELTYHRQYAAEWVVRLGDGTDESHRRMQVGLDQVFPYLGELFAAYDAETETLSVLRHVAAAGGLSLPEMPPHSAGTGRSGGHTEYLAPLLAELQSVARAHPEGAW